MSLTKVTYSMIDSAPVSVLDYGAIGDGVADSTAAIVAALAAADNVVMPSGSYKITANITVDEGKTLAFEPGALITASSVFTLDFDNNAILIADRYKIFGASASATNLKTAFPEWWGATHSTTTEQNTEFQAALDALKISGELLLNDGFYALDGATALSISKGQAVIGAGMYQTTIRINTAAANVFAITNEIGAAVKGLRIGVTSTPTSGVAISIRQNNSGERVGRYRIDDIWMDNVYGGIEVRGYDGTETVNTGTISNLYMFGVFDFAAKFEWVENLLTSRLFINSDTGSGGGAPNDNIVMLNKCQSVDFLECVSSNTSGAGLNVTNTAGSISRGNDVRWCKFVACLFDDCETGIDLNNCSDIRFTNCWSSSNGRTIRGYAGNGVWIRDNTEAISFIGGVVSNNGQRGFRIEPGADGVMIKDVQIAGNSVNDPTTNPFWAIDIFANTSNFSITGCQIRGVSYGWTDGDSRGIQVRTGTSDNYIITNNQISNAFNNDYFSDGGSGTNKIVTGNLTW